MAAGRFSFAGETRSLGLEPDWLHADLPADEEWRIDWVKFYYGLDLADAFRATGDRRFLDAWERLVASFIVQVPPDRDDSEVTARRVLNWIYAWQRLPEVMIGAEIHESLREQVAHVRANLSPERNHRTLELYALLIAALSGVTPELLDFAVGALHENLLTDFGADGVHRERSTHYHLIALRSFVGARENCRRFGVALPSGFDERLALACEFARDCRRPDGTIPALSDADTGSYDELLALAGRLLSREDLLFGESGSYPDGGYFVQRARDRYLIFDCGPLGDGGHGHYDALSVEAWAGGRPLVMDPGPLHVRRGLAELAALLPRHRRAQHRDRRRSRPDPVRALALGASVRGGAVPRARAARRARHAARRGPQPGLRGAAPPHGHVHDGAHWEIEDELIGERPHRYDLRWHLPPGPARVVGDTVITPGAELVIRGARSIALEDGWISPAYGVREAAPVVSAMATGAYARFVTLLKPRWS